MNVCVDARIMSGQDAADDLIDADGLRAPCIIFGCSIEAFDLFVVEDDILILASLLGFLQVKLFDRGG